MSDVKAMAFQRGMAMLKVSGAVYAVLHNEVSYVSADTRYALEHGGNIEGTLEVVVTKKRRAPNGPRHDWMYTGYLEAVKALQPGETWTYTCSSKEEAIGLQKCVTGRSAQLHGPGTCISAVDYKTLKLEVLRVE